MDTISVAVSILKWIGVPSFIIGFFTLLTAVVSWRGLVKSITSSVGKLHETALIQLKTVRRCLFATVVSGGIASAAIYSWFRLSRVFWLPDDGDSSNIAYVYDKNFSVSEVLQEAIRYQGYDQTPLWIGIIIIFLISVLMLSSLLSSDPEGSILITALYALLTWGGVFLLILQIAVGMLSIFSNSHDSPVTVMFAIICAMFSVYVIGMFGVSSALGKIDKIRKGRDGFAIEY